MNLCVKICGVTRPGDVESAVAAGADAVGFVLYERSPRFVPLERLRELTALVPPGVLRVGVVVNAPLQRVLRAAAAGGLDVIQFHGDESDALLVGFAAARVWRAVRLESGANVETAARCPAERLVVDAGDGALRGGTGKVCDWSLAAELARRRPVLLAGGLTPANVAGAVRQVRPWGVDVSSGVEAAPGVKDSDLVREFVAAARAAAAAL